jgi:hypothetical protein
MTFAFEKGVPYQDVKGDLIANGWKPLKNTKILSSSLYAQALYEQGIVEVVDCISMELDGCWFHFTKKNQIVEVKTITRALAFEKIRILKSR